MRKIILLLLTCWVHGVVLGQSYSIPKYINSDYQSKTSELKKDKSKKYEYNEESLKSLKSKLTPNIIKTQTYSFQNENQINREEFNEYIDLQKKEILNLCLKAKNSKKIDSILVSNKIFIDENFDEKNHKEINDLRDALKKDYTNLNFLSKEKRPKTFYLWNSKNYDISMFNEYFSGKKTFNAISNISVQTFLEDTYINSQIISFYFNYIKLSLSGSLKATNNSQNDSDKIKENLTNILHNNGSLNLNFTLPLIYNRDRKEHIHYGLFAETSVGLTPNFETTESAYFSNDLLVTNQIGLNFKFDISSNENKTNEKARFIVELPINYIYGNKKSYELLNISDNSSVKIKIGAVLGDKLNFAISGPLYSTNNFIQKTPFLFAINFSPEQILK